MCFYHLPWRQSFILKMTFSDTVWDGPASTYDYSVETGAQKLRTRALGSDTPGFWLCYLRKEASDKNSPCLLEFLHVLNEFMYLEWLALGTCSSTPGSAEVCWGWLELAYTGWLYLSFLRFMDLIFGSLSNTMVGTFTPKKSTNSYNWGPPHSEVSFQCVTGFWKSNYHSLSLTSICWLVNSLKEPFTSVNCIL